MKKYTLRPSGGIGIHSALKMRRSNEHSGSNPDSGTFWSNVQKSTKCWVWKGAQETDGYGAVVFEGKRHKAHRVAFYLTYGVWPKVCRHVCDNPLCVRPKHLLDGSHADNVRDRVTRGRSATGERNGRSKLTWSDVMAIRSLLGEGITKSELSRAFGVDRKVIRDIEHYRTWKPT